MKQARLHSFAQKRLRPLTAALALGLAAAVLLGCVQAGQGPQLQDKLIRLHVVAASDTPADQAIKLRVRDAVLEVAGPLLHGAKDARQARAILAAHLEGVQAAARAALPEGTQVQVTLAPEYFSARDYSTFSLPEGVYQALRVTIGPGQGHNWWCVVFPSLCLCATTQEVEAAAASAGFTPEEIAAITQGSEGVVFRWRVLELWKRLFG